MNRTNKHKVEWALAFALVWSTSLAGQKSNCPQVLIDTGKEKPLLKFLNFPKGQNMRFYAIVADAGKNNWEHLVLANNASDHGLMESSKPFGRLYFIIAHEDIKELARYKINHTRGAAPALEQIPRELNPDPLEKFPKGGLDVNGCSLDF